MDAMQEKLAESYGKVRDLEVERSRLLQDNKDLREQLQVEKQDKVEDSAMIRELQDFDDRLYLSFAPRKYNRLRVAL